MKSIQLMIFLMLSASFVGYGQKMIRDKHITNQQERMVFKQWDRSKFTPTSGFAGLNPMYWLTWGLHPNYPKTDLRPLGPFGPQTQRLGLLAAMQHTENAYKLQADTLGSTATSELIGHSAAFSALDPLWQLYYKKQFRDLLDPQESQILSGLDAAGISYLRSVGDYDWFTRERGVLAQRLRAAMSSTMDRGSRISAYHRLLQQYRGLSAGWETRKQNAAGMLKGRDKVNRIRQGNIIIPVQAGNRTDIQIADEILSRSKL